MSEIELPEDLPIWANWIARDDDGSLWYFESRPHVIDGVWDSTAMGRIGEEVNPAWPHLNDPDWTKNIMEVKR